MVFTYSIIKYSIGRFLDELLLNHFILNTSRYDCQTISQPQVWRQIFLRERRIAIHTIHSGSAETDTKLFARQVVLQQSWPLVSETGHVFGDSVGPGGLAERDRKQLDSVLQHSGH